MCNADKNPKIKDINYIQLLTPLSLVNDHDDVLNPSSPEQNVTDLSI